MTPKVLIIPIILGGLKQLFKPKPRPKPCTTQRCRNAQKHWHHEMPKQFRNEFEDRGIDINARENGRVIPAAEHRGIHARGYNAQWGQFFANNPDATRGQVLAQRDLMVTQYGLGRYPRPAGSYPIK